MNFECITNMSDKNISTSLKHFFELIEGNYEANIDDCNECDTQNIEDQQDLR